MFASNELKGKLLSEQLIELASFVKQAAVNGIAAHEVELTLFRGVMKIGRELLSMFIELQGTGDIGSELTLPDGSRLERQPEIYERKTGYAHCVLSLARYKSNDSETTIELILFFLRCNEYCGAFGDFSDLKTISFGSEHACMGHTHSFRCPTRYLASD